MHKNRACFHYFSTFGKPAFMRRIILFIAFIFSFAESRSQDRPDTLFFMNGEFLNAKVIDTANFTVHCKYLRRGRERELRIDRERLFGIRFKDGTMRTYYYYDTLLGNYFTIDETRMFIYGEHDAIKGYKPRLDFVGAFLVGTASPLLTPTIMAPLPVFAFTAVVTLAPRIRGNKKVITNLDYTKNEAYLIGYERVARKKKSFYSLVGGLAGLAVGFAIDVLVLKDKLQ